MKENQGRSVGPGQRPRISRKDLNDIAAKIRYDLTAAQAKLTELMSLIAAIPIPDEPLEFNADRFRTWIQNTAHVYTDASIRAELELHGAPAEFIAEAIELAGEVRARAERDAERLERARDAEAEAVA